MKKVLIGFSFVLGSAVFTSNAICEVPPLSIIKNGVASHGVEVILLNRSERRVVGFCARTEKGGLRLTKFFPPHHGIMPGDTFTATVPVAGMPVAEAEQESRSFAITCVATDGGVWGTVNEDAGAMREELAGVAFEAAKLGGIFTTVRDASNERLPSAVQDAITAIAHLGMTLDDGSEARGNFALGIRAANYHVTAWLREVATMCETGANIGEVRTQLEDVGNRVRDLLAVASAGRGALQ